MKLRLKKGTKIKFGDEVPNEVMTTVRLISKKWTVPIMYQIYLRNQGFSDLKREIGKKLSSTMLSRALENLQTANLIEKRIISTSPFRVEYSLTVLGSDFCSLIESLGGFGEKYLSVQASEHE
ncbi:MAG: winged helix-turn-helix transcriptional regulator [Candidatus Heimdallarchaeota archaeon]